MENKIIAKGTDTQTEVINGVRKAVGAIKTTLGPSGKCVAIHTSYGVDITRDGATVSKSISLKSQTEDIGAQLIRKAAENTERQAGDGTSSVSVLTEEMCIRGQKALKVGANVNEIKSGMIKAEKFVKDYIASQAIPVGNDLEKVRQIATISANNDPEVGNLIADCLGKLGMGATITADMSSGLETTIDVVAGMKVERGWSSPAFITDPKSGECTLEDAYVAVFGERISSVSQLVPVLESMQKSGVMKPILFIVDEMDENVLQMLAFNVVSGALRCCVIKGIDFGDGRKNQMQDIATFTGADFFCQENGTEVSQATVANLGKAEKIVINRDHTIITGGFGSPDEIEARAEIIKAKLQDPAITDYDKTKYEKRLSNLTGGIGVIKAGGATEAEKTNRKATIEDAILASRSAIAEGCVPGSGYVFLNASIAGKKDTKFFNSLVGDEKEGAMIVFDSLPVIMKTIAMNCGMSPDVVVDTVSKKKNKPGEAWGLNAKTKKFSNLVEDGILDSAKVLRVSLENSISTASMILLIDCTIIDEPQKDCCCGGERTETGNF